MAAAVLASSKGNRLSAGQEANRRAPRVFAAAPESRPMADTPTGGPKLKAESPPRRAMGGMGSGSRMRNRAPLRLLSSLRGAGTLIWNGRSVAAAYELDVFAVGDAHLATGTLEGDFSGGMPDEGAPPADDARLTLSDGRQFEVEIVHVEVDAVEFEARRPSELAAWVDAPHPAHRD